MKWLQELLGKCGRDVQVFAEGSLVSFLPSSQSYGQSNVDEPLSDGARLVSLSNIFSCILVAIFVMTKYVCSFVFRPKKCI
jgi:hypothetical protein